MQQLGKKLQLKEGQGLLLLNAPPSVAQLLSEEGYVVTTEKEGDTTFDAVQLFIHDKAELNCYAQGVVDKLKPAGRLWIAYPKKSSGIVSDLNRDEGWGIMSELGFETVRQIAIDEIWSSVRFKHRCQRKEPSKMGAEYPGIDKQNRIVRPPADLQKALDEAGLNSKFQAMSFTCKKEYVLAVLNAKRAETRFNRIERTIAQLAENSMNGI